MLGLVRESSELIYMWANIYHMQIKVRYSRIFNFKFCKKKWTKIFGQKLIKIISKKDVVSQISS